MQIELHEKFNQRFTEARYLAFLEALNSATSVPINFRVAESPLFFSSELTQQLVQAANEIVEQLEAPDFLNHAQDAIPSGKAVPNEDRATTFLQLDFGLTRDLNGQIKPQLIELQGFASLYCYQVLLDRTVRKFHEIPDEMSQYFCGIEESTYIECLRRAIIGDCRPENVVLMEIFPKKQYTLIDFEMTRALLGIETVCLSEVKKQGSRLFYNRNGKLVPIERIYNRVIFDELDRTEIACEFSFQEPLDVKWIGHPNWFYKLSKHSLPKIKSQYVPQCWRADDFDYKHSDLAQFVLKPLFSFAGSGVLIDLKCSDFANLKNPEHYIVQRKVEYADILPTPDGPAKAEVRLMFVRDREKLRLVNNLVRLSKGKMIGVSYNKDRTWVGSTVGYHFKDSSN